MSSPIFRSGDINLPADDSKVAKKLRRLNILKISLAVIGVLTAAFGIGCGFAFTPILFTLVGVGCLMLVLSVGLTYLAHKIKNQELPPQGFNKGNSS